VIEPQNFLVNLKRHHQGLFNNLESTLTGRYLDRKQKNAFSMVKPSESTRTLEQQADDLFLLVERFKEDDQVRSMTSYQLLALVLREQCLVKPISHNLYRTFMQQMDAWSRDRRWPFAREEKGRVTAD